MKIKYAVSGLLSLFLIPASIECFAQAATLSDCQGIQDRLARYACYDKWDSASGVVRQSVPATRATPQDDDTSLFGRILNRDSDAATPAAAAATQAPTTTADFGRQQASNARVVEGDDGSELIDRVAAIEPRGPSLVTITLDSGQQWQQMLSKRYPLEVGDEVRIYPTRWGNAFRLSSSRVGGFIQVERVDDGSSVAVATPAPAATAVAPAPSARVESTQDDADEPGLLGRTVGALGGVGSRIGGIFSRDSDAEQEQEAPQPAAASAPAAPTEATVGSFGRSASSNARVVEGDVGSELIDTVARIEQTGPSLVRITLESGQQWQQMISKRYTLEVGDEVRIYPTRWGNAFRLSSERAGGYIQVERVD